MDTGFLSILVTAGIAIIGYIATYYSAQAATTKLINDTKEELLEKIAKHELSVMTAQLSIVALRSELERWTGDKINGLSVMLIDRMYVLADRVAVLEGGARDKRERDAAIGLHRPDEASKAMDEKLNPLIDKIQTTTEREALKEILREHIGSILQDTGQRPLLDAMYARDEPTRPMPDEPTDKAPDQTFQERRDKEMADMKEKQDKIP